MASPPGRTLLAYLGTRPIPPGPLERVGRVVELATATSMEELRQSLPRADALLLWDFGARGLPEVWHLAGRVRWVHVAAAGVNAAMFPALRDSDVVVTNARGVGDDSMAEYALALLLHFAKRLDRTVANQRERRWEFYLSRMLAGKTLVIVGLGSIGRALAQRARALGMRVVGVRRGGMPDPAADIVYPVEHLRAALSEGDYVVLILPLTDETRGLFGLAEFAALRRDAILVNLARGGVVDENALLEALRAGRLQAAAFDVFTEEPLSPNSPLWSAPNLLVSPHLGGDDEAYPQRLLAQWEENVGRWVRGEALLNVVDKARGY